MVDKVSATDAALKFIEELKARNGPLMFYQSGGCCDGSVPMCFHDGDFLIGDQDLLLGHIGGCPFYMHAKQYEYSQYTQLIVDVGPGPGSDFSLDGVEDMHFVTISRPFTDAEIDALEMEDVR